MQLINNTAHPRAQVDADLSTSQPTLAIELQARKLRQLFGVPPATARLLANFAFAQEN